MTDGWFGIAEMMIFLGIPLVWGVWELVRLRREQARDRARDAARTGDRDRDLSR